MRPASTQSHRAEMCRLAAAGLSANAIAIETDWAPSTVRRYVAGALCHPRHRRVDLGRWRRIVRAYDAEVAVGPYGCVEAVRERFGYASIASLKVPVCKARRRLASEGSSPIGDRTGGGGRSERVPSGPGCRPSDRTASHSAGSAASIPSRMHGDHQP